MSAIQIRVENLSKLYRLGANQASYRTLRDTLADTFMSTVRGAAKLFRHEAGDTGNVDETIWALKDVSLEIRYGEVVGIIGRNGAGKSTLLKVLSRITEPTTGFAEIHGRVGSLLEVGTGFHPELTGRENIYLNGAILGMKKAEIERKFDEIVAFSEVERFIDTPVKHYSSGMSMRLAFAVAAHLEPEILIVDEVLAVGDARFQRKCLHKMQDVGQQGRTVLFVSHNMPAVVRLCERTILLDEGRVLRDGLSHQVISAYLNCGLEMTAAREWPDPAKAPGGDIARLCAVRIRTEDGQIIDTVDIRKPISVEMEYEVFKSGCVLMPHYHIYNDEGVHMFSAHDTDPTWRRRARPAGRWVSTARIPGNFLSEGTVFVTSGLVTLNPNTGQFFERDVVSFHVIDSQDGDSARGDWPKKMDGIVRPLLKWRTQFSPAAQAGMFPATD